MSSENDASELFTLAAILQEQRHVALVGASDNWRRPSYYVMKYLLKQGYSVFPVNPRLAGQSILGQLVYATLADIPHAIDIVDVFRPSEACPEIAKQAAAIGAKTLWLQIGVKSTEAEAIASAAGLQVVMDKCTKIEHSKISGLLGLAGFSSGFISAHRQSAPPKAMPKRDAGLFISDKLETLSIHAGSRPDSSSSSRQTPIYQTVGFAFDDTDHAASLYDLQQPGNIYGRLSNPTTAVLEQRLAALDGGVGAVCVSSGHAAQLVALYPLMAPSKRIIASNKLYGGSITQFAFSFKKFGWDVEFVDISDEVQVKEACADPQAAVLFAESLANPDGNVSDIEKLAQIAKQHHLPLMIDNTMATPIICQPKKWGADIVVYSTTKFLAGQGQALGGAVIDTGNYDWANGVFPSLCQPDPAYHNIRFAETFGPLSYITYCHANVLRDLGPVLSPHNAYLTLLGLETLPLRMRQHMENAEKIAHFLVQHPKVEQVSWAGLESSPYHSLADKYLSFGAGSVFTFAVQGGYEAGMKLVEHCNLVTHLANIGDTRSLILHPASTTHRQLSAEQRQASGLSDNTLRLSVGIEHSDDIIADLEGALACI